MQTRLTTWEATLKLAEKAGFTPEQAKAFLQAQAELAYQNVDNGYPIAGLGILTKTERPERRMVLQFGPRAGQEVTLPAKKVLKFWVAKAAKDVVFRRGAAPPDLAKTDMAFDEEPRDNAE
ncbi:MAG: HU family DNA-binding protein [Tepidisphaeraceae bacterium]|jgi:DNA-binding protein HU-beta